MYFPFILSKECLHRLLAWESNRASFSILLAAGWQAKLLHLLIFALIVSKHNIRNSFFERRDRAYTDKIENNIFSHIQYKEIQIGSGPKSYVKKGFLIYEEMRKFFTTYEEAVSHI